MFVLFATAMGTGWNDARSIAMAGSYTAIARGYEAIGFNPANIGLSDRPNRQVQLFALGSTLNNNSFSMGDYEKYNGNYLSESDKRDILSMIPSDGLEFVGNASASALSFAYGALAFSSTFEAAGRGAITKDVIDLAFYGNRIGETVTVDDSEAEALAHVDLNIAYGRKIKSYDWGEIAAGVNLKYIHGLGYANIGSSRASATTGVDGIDADGSVVIRSATGGSGFGLDIGAAALCRDTWVFSAGIRNLISSVEWSRNTRETEYTLDVVSFTAETADEDSTVVSDEIERSIGSFSESLGPQANLGASRVVGKFLLASDLKLGLADKAGVSTAPEISAGAEFHQFRFLPLRAGVSAGGIRGISLALGCGLSISSFHMDLAWASTGTLLPSFGKGISIAVSSGLRF
jgi:hypothetical protein